MGYDGVVVGGRVEVAGPVPLPDGTPVRVEPVAPPTAVIPPLRERLKNVIGKATGLPADAATDHDRYIREAHRT
jgi:hypothetical protein